MTESKAVAIPRRIKMRNSDEHRWRLVMQHSDTSDFFYAVISTHIICRPSCPSRRPRRANVEFFNSVADGVAAGYRACRRCRPEAVKPPQPVASNQVASACEYILEHNGNVQLADIASHVGLSARYFHGLFKTTVGTTPGAYAASIKQRSASQSLSPPSEPNSVNGGTEHENDWSSLLPEFDNGNCGLRLPDDSMQGTLTWPNLDWDSINLDNMIMDSFDGADWFSTSFEPCPEIEPLTFIDPSLILSTTAMPP